MKILRQLEERRSRQTRVFVQRIDRTGSRNFARSPQRPCAAAAKLASFSFGNGGKRRDSLLILLPELVVAALTGTLWPGGSGAHETNPSVLMRRVTTTGRTDFFRRQIESLVRNQRYSCGSFLSTKRRISPNVIRRMEPGRMRARTLVAFIPTVETWALAPQG